MKRAALLARVSTDLQEYKRQIDDLKKLAKQEGYVISDDLIYAEKASGFAALDTRIELTRLLNDIREGTKNIKMIFITELSRIARNPRNIRKVIEEATDLGVSFYIPNVGRTLNEDGTENDMVTIAVNMYAQMAKMEADTTKSRTKSGRRFSAQLGKNIGGEHYPFGYTADANKMLQINPAEAEVVRVMFDLCIAGYGGMQTAQILKQRGYKNRDGLKDFNAFVIRNQLKNPLYKGLRPYVKVNGPTPKRSQYEYFDLPHLAIVSEETFEKANQAAKNRMGSAQPNLRYLYLLNPQARCGCCGSRYVAKTTHKVEAYVCYTSRYKRQECMNPGLGITLLESAAWTVLKDSPYIYNHLKESSSDTKRIENEIQRLQASLEMVEEEITTKVKERKKITNLVIKEALDEDEGAEMLKKLNQQLKTLESRVEGYKKEISSKTDLTKRVDGIDYYGKAIKEISKDRVKIKDVLDNMVEKVIVNGGRPIILNKVCSEFLISFFLYGKEEPITVYLKRKGKTIQFDRSVNKLVKYKDDVLQGKVTDIFKAYGTAKSISARRDNKVVPLDIIQFERQDISK